MLSQTAAVRAKGGPTSPHDPAAATRRLVDSLRDPGCYPHPAGPVEVVETHISHVLLAGEYAYKIRKPVRLPFLDFSTLAARHADCEAELRLNARTAPEIYLGVCAITGTPTAPRIDGEGDPLEYAVRMRRFPAGALLSELAARGALTTAHVEALAERVAAFHAAATRARPAPRNLADHATRPALENFPQMLALGPRTGTAVRLRELQRWTRIEKQALLGTFADRALGGFERDGHGDLHLGNVVLLDGAPIPFDCLEFSAELRQADVASDVAFLAMDLERHGLERLAARFVNRYLEATGDYGALAVLRFYEVYRAVVRAKVALIRARQERSAAHAAAEDECDAQLRLAQRLVRRRPPLMVLMHGPSGSGKTVASGQLLEALGAVRLRSDVERKRIHGVAAHLHAAAPPGEGLYGETANRATREWLLALARKVLSSGYPVIVDATFLAKADRARFASLAAELRAAFRIVSCAAPVEVLRARVAARERDGRDASDAGIAVLESQLAAAEPLDGYELAHELSIDTSRPEAPAALEDFAARLRAEVG